MKQLRLILLINWLLLLSIMCCKKDNPYVPSSDPKKAILGKWELIQMGNYPSMINVDKSSGYVEYKADSVLLQVSADGQVYHMKYWIDSLYHEAVFIDGIPPPILNYEYKFYENKLRLDVYMYAQYRTTIYERKK